LCYLSCLVAAITEGAVAVLIGLANFSSTGCGTYFLLAGLAYWALIVQVSEPRVGTGCST
jgi:hypothetical protein